jgi:hypothetical protein
MEEEMKTVIIKNKNKIIKMYICVYQFNECSQLFPVISGSGGNALIFLYGL